MVGKTKGIPPKVGENISQLTVKSCHAIPTQLLSVPDVVLWFSSAKKGEWTGKTGEGTVLSRCSPTNRTPQTLSLAQLLNEYIEVKAFNCFLHCFAWSNTLWCRRVNILSLSFWFSGIQDQASSFYHSPAWTFRPTIWFNEPLAWGGGKERVLRVYERVDDVWWNTFGLESGKFMLNWSNDNQLADTWSQVRENWFVS